MQLTPKRLAFIQAWLQSDCRDATGAVIAAGYAEAHATAIAWRLLRTADVRHFAGLMAPVRLQRALTAVFASPLYVPPKPIKRPSRVAEIVAGAAGARVERERRRHRFSPWLNL